jgi:porin
LHYGGAFLGAIDMYRVRASLGTVAALALGAVATSVLADEQPATQNRTPDPSLATSLADKGELESLKSLAAQGITVGLNYISEGLANTGGVKQSAIFDGRFEGVLDADLEKLWGMKGLIFHANAFQIHGAGLSRENLANLMVVSSVEALPTTRLFELYLEQKASETVSIRFGQVSADTEFLVSDNGTNFVNSTFGWADIASVDLPNGGDAYPLAALGVRVKFEPSKNISFLAGIYNGDPAGPGKGDPQERNRYGLNFRITDPPLFAQEAQFRFNQEKGADGLPGTIKVGAWEHTASFQDQRLDAAGVSIALSHKEPARIRGDYGFYAVLDQQIFRLPGATADHGVHAFVRLSASPPDRNLIEFHADAGFVFKGFLPSRPDDNFGIAFAHAGISDRAIALDRDRNAVEGVHLPVRDYETVIEAYYKFQVLPSLTIQPDLQYIFHPGGHVAQDDGLVIKDALVAGVRLSIAY